MFLADWQLLALFSSVFTAVYIHTNNIFKLDGLTVVFLRGLIIAAALMPSIFLFPLPANMYFIWVALAVGACVAVGDKALFAAAAKHGGRLTSLFIALKIFIVFTVWSLIQPAAFLDLIQHPATFIGILGVYGIMVLALMSLRKNDASFTALIAILPAAFFLGFADILTKLGVTDMPMVTFFQFMALNQLGAMVVAAALTAKSFKTPTTIFNAKNIKGVCWILVPFTLTVGSFLVAIAKSPNPAYVGAITVLSTVWLTLYYKFTRGDDASIFSTMLLAASAVGLVVLTH